MLKSCKYCGHIHEERHMCSQKKEAEERRQKKNKETKALQFRRSQAWTHKSIEVRKRDSYMCVCCKAQEAGTVFRYNTRDLSVHHITPVEEDYGLRLDGSNLITVCPAHHKMCETGEIPRDRQRSLALGFMVEEGEGKGGHRPYCGTGFHGEECQGAADTPLGILGL